MFADNSIKIIFFEKPDEDFSFFIFEIWRRKLVDGPNIIRMSIRFDMSDDRLDMIIYYVNII